MLKNVLRFSLGVGLIAVLGGVALYFIKSYLYVSDQRYQTEERMRELEKQYADDPYGGDTPEETLRLFIEALKAGDTDLAAKYFILDKQEQWTEDLAKIKDKNLLGVMIEDISRAKKYRSQENQVIFTAGNDAGEAIANIIIVQTYGKWKLRDI